MGNLARHILKIFSPANWSKDFGLKLVSLFFAIFLWYFVVGEDKVDMNLLVPIEIVNLPRDLVISNQYKKDLDVTVSGSRGLIRSIGRQNISRTVDLSKAEPGTIVIRNTPEDISLPRGIRVLRIQPTHLVFTIDRLIEKDLTIHPMTTGEPAPGYSVAEIRLEPDEIHLTGPQGLLGPIPFLATVPIDISGLDKSTNFQTHLDLTPELAELIGESVVTARVVVKRQFRDLVIPSLPLSVVNGKEEYGYLLEPPAVAVTAHFPATMADGAVTAKITLVVDVDNLAPGRHVIPVEARAAAEITVSKVEPPQVQVDVSPIIAPQRPPKVRRAEPPPATP